MKPLAMHVASHCKLRNDDYNAEWIIFDVELMHDV